MPPDSSAPAYDGEIYIKVYASIAVRRDLLPFEKLLYSLVAGLCAKSGYCDGSNGYLAMRLGSDAKYISRVIAGLKSRGLIEVVIERGFERRICITYPLPREKEGVPPVVGGGGHSGMKGAATPVQGGFSPQEEGVPTLTIAPLPPQGEHILKKNQSKKKEEIKSETLSPSPPVGSHETAAAFGVFQPSVLEERPKEEKQKQESPKQEPEKLKKPLLLPKDDPQFRAAWEALDTPAKAPFLSQAEAELRAAGLDNPPARAIEPRAFNLFKKSQAAHVPDN